MFLYGWSAQYIYDIWKQDVVADGSNNVQRKILWVYCGTDGIGHHNYKMLPVENLSHTIPHDDTDDATDFYAVVLVVLLS